MTPEEKLTAILEAVQVDPGNRGLGKDPHDNLFLACRSDFRECCLELAAHPSPLIWIITGFQIPTANPPAWETDGPLGALFLLHAFKMLGVRAEVPNGTGEVFHDFDSIPSGQPTHVLSIERVGPAKDGRCRTMRGRDITEQMFNVTPLFATGRTWKTIGIGDGGNELGMGKIAHETVCKNIPNGHLIHCQVPTDFLLVAGVSNWGAYSLAAGLFACKGLTPAPELFSAEQELRRLEELIRLGKLVDGVTGLPTATVDGLSWEDYLAPFEKIRAVLAR
jgi:D-glutamate cyclase